MYGCSRRAFGPSGTLWRRPMLLAFDVRVCAHEEVIEASREYLTNRDEESIIGP